MFSAENNYVGNAKTRKAFSGYIYIYFPAQIRSAEIEIKTLKKVSTLPMKSFLHKSQRNKIGSTGSHGWLRSLESLQSHS